VCDIDLLEALNGVWHKEGPDEVHVDEADELRVRLVEDRQGAHHVLPEFAHGLRSRQSGMREEKSHVGLARVGVG